MIFIDVEATGLLNASATHLSQQPHMIEIYCLKLDGNYNFVDEIDTLIRPPIPISEEITKITKITNQMVFNKEPFYVHYQALVDLFLGETKVIAHNITYDLGMLWVELARIEKEVKFPWPTQWICTLEQSLHLKNKRLKLTDLHEMATGRPHNDNAHRAKQDVLALVNCYRWMREQGYL